MFCDVCLWHRYGLLRLAVVQLESCAWDVCGVTVGAAVVAAALAAVDVVGGGVVVAVVVAAAAGVAAVVAVAVVAAAVVAVFGVAAAADVGCGCCWFRSHIRASTAIHFVGQVAALLFAASVCPSG